MPHVGGSGSSSSGSSGGSSSSSRLESSHGRSSVDSKPDYYRGQESYYPGSHKYHYRYNGEDKYYYSDTQLTKKDIKYNDKGLVFLGIMLTVMWLIVLLSQCGFYKGGPINTGNYNAVVIKDNVGLMDREEYADLSKTLLEFYDRTGVAVSVLTRTKRVNSSGSITDEAYDMYCDMFKDECHWLIYYIAGDNDTASRQWQLICGDNCSKVLSATQEKRFMYKFRINLSEGMPLGDAITGAINSLRPDLLPGFCYKLDTPIYGGLGDRAYLFSSILLFLIFLSVRCSFRSIMRLSMPLSELEKAKMNAVRVKCDTLPMTCSNCGNTSDIPLDEDTCPCCGNKICKQTV